MSNPLLTPEEYEELGKTALDRHLEFIQESQRDLERLHAILDARARSHSIMQEAMAKWSSLIAKCAAGSAFWRESGSVGVKHNRVEH